MIEIDGKQIDDTNRRHGDVLITKLDPNTPIKDYRVVEDNVVAHGESGNKHVLQGNAQILEDQTGNMIIKTSAECEIVHEEHLPLKLQEEILVKVGREQEYDYAAHVQRLVHD